MQTIDNVDRPWGVHIRGRLAYEARTCIECETWCTHKNLIKSRDPRQPSAFELVEFVRIVKRQPSAHSAQVFFLTDDDDDDDGIIA